MIKRRPTRVLFLDHVSRMSGAEQSLSDLVVGLSKGPIEPIVVLPADGPLATKLRAEGVLVRMVPMSRRMLETSRGTLGAKPFVLLARLWSFFVASWRIHRIIREMRPQVIHSNTMKTHLLAILPAMVNRVPLVWHVRDILPRGWLRRAFVQCARIPSLIVVPSRSVAVGFGKRRKRIYKKLRLIPNGIHVEDFFEPNGAGDGLRMEVGANGHPLVGIVGRISQWKGQEVFVRAAAMLAHRHPKVQFAVIGAVMFPENDLPFQEKLQDLVAEADLSDRIAFLGWRSPVEAMSALDVLVHASIEPEPFGRTIVEGMAAGIPVVASSSGATRELLPPNAGILVPPNRPEILADALDQLLSDRHLREDMGANGRAIATNYFDVRRTIAGVGAMYQELAKKKRWRPMKQPRSRYRSEPISWPAPVAQQPVAPKAQRRVAAARVERQGRSRPEQAQQPVLEPAYQAVAEPAIAGTRAKRLVARIDSRSRRARPVPHTTARRYDEEIAQPVAAPLRSPEPAVPARAIPAMRARPRAAEPMVARVEAPARPAPVEAPARPRLVPAPVEAPARPVPVEAPAARVEAPPRPRRKETHEGDGHTNGNGNGHRGGNGRSNGGGAGASSQVAPRRALPPETTPTTPEPSARLTREAPVPAARAAATVPMRLVPAREDAAEEHALFTIAPKPLYNAVKRAIDLVVALGVLVIGSPLWLLIALLIKLDSRGPVLFRNTVIGEDRVPFTYYKFRSMRVDVGDDGHRAFIERYVRHDAGHEHDGRTVFKFVGDRRVTKIGRLIRKLSIDEVPQLINVVKGQMSIVGPRPPLEYEYNLYDDYSKQRLAVRPGLTGLQQVEARHTAAFRDKIEMDLDYIRRRSVLLDLLIMLKTVPAALRGE